MKKCSTCKKIKTDDEFYPDNRTPSGLKSQCKSCHMAGSIRTRNPENHRFKNKLFMREHRRTHLEEHRAIEREASKKREKNEKTKARLILNSAVRSGKIIKPDHCSKCGTVGKITAHHPDYKEPLEVEWLCYTCHGNK